MTAEPARATRLEPNTSAPDEREQLIESLSQLLSSGRPLSEVLAEAKRLATSNALDGPAPATVIHRSREPSPDTGRTSEDNADPMERLRAVLAARTEQENSRRFRLPELTGRIRGWLAPAIGAAVLATAAAAALFANLPVADAISVVPTLIGKPALDPPQKTDARPSAQSGASPGSNTVVQNLKAEQVARLLAGGDALASRADLRSARLLYERAVDAGEAKAALRLGASYDPLLLTRAGIRGAQGDPALAAYWYRRARDLGAVEAADTLLKSLKQ